MKKNIVLVILALLGFLTTLHLSIAHFRGVDPVCPVGGSEGCAVAASSTYAYLFGIPVAYLGFLVWAGILFYSVRYHRKGTSLTPVILLSGIGVMVAGYFNAVMIYKLGVLCFWCETSHAAIILTFIFSTHLAHGHKLNWIEKSLGIALALFLTPFVITISATPDASTVQLAQCLADKNVTMYGAFWCPHCKEQKELFGSAFENVNYVECSLPDGERQTEYCTSMNITGYPTWIRSDGERRSRTLALDELKNWASC